MIVKNWVPVYLVGLCLFSLSYTSVGYQTSENLAIKRASRGSSNNLKKEIDTRKDESLNHLETKYQDVNQPSSSNKILKDKSKSIQKKIKTNNKVKKAKPRKHNNIKNKIKESPKLRKNVKKTFGKLSGDASNKSKGIRPKIIKKPKKKTQKTYKRKGGKKTAKKYKANKQNIDISSGSACGQSLTLATFYTYNIYTNYGLKDKGPKECSVTFKGMQDTDRLYFICKEFSLQKTCVKESLTIKDLTSGAEGEYCGSTLKSDPSSDTIIKSDGSSISLKYARKKIPGKKCPTAGFFCQISAIPEGLADEEVTRGLNTELSAIVSWIGLGKNADACGGETTLDYGYTTLVYSSFDSKGNPKCKHTVKGPDDVNLNVKCSVFNMANPCKKENLQVFDKKLSGKAKKYCKGKELSEYTASGNILEFKLNRKKLKKKQCQGGFICQVSVPNVLCTDQWPAPQSDIPFCGWVGDFKVCSCADFQLAGGCNDAYPQPDISFCKRTCQICEDFGTVDESNKPGECPDVGDFTGSCDITALSCTLDDECPSISKCCPFGCGSQCLIPGPSACEAGTSWVQGCEECFCLEGGTIGCQQLAICNYCPPSNPKHPNCNIVKPTDKPTVQPTDKQPVNSTFIPTFQSTVRPSVKPTFIPTAQPTDKPSDKPTFIPTAQPTDKQTFIPTVQPTAKPTTKPPVNPTNKPTGKPTVKPPTVKPTEKPNPPSGIRPYCDNCGTSSISVARGINGNRIVGGQQATKGEYPWQVYLEIIIGNFGARCGGSIIKKRWILSAAHCFTGDAVSNIIKLEIHVGAHNLQDFSDQGQIIVFNQQDVANRVKTHPNYDEYKVLNDIALIELKQDLVFTSRIQPVCLADLSDFAAGKQGVATGWGITSYEGKQASEILLEVRLELIDLATCQDLYQKTPNQYDITDTMICTLSAGKDACSGDSGGPLVIQLDNGKWVQVGLTSFGYRCAYPNAPGVWTHVAKYKTWIDQTTGSTQC